MVSALVLLSRSVHIGSMAVLAGSSFVSVFQELALPKHTYTVAAVLSLLSGLFNAHAAQPKRMEERARTWRMVIYVLKVLLWLGMSPLLDVVLAKAGLTGKKAEIRTGLCGVLIVVSGYARYFREEAVAAVEAGKEK